MRELEAFARSLHELVLQVLARGEGDGVDERVKTAELLVDLLEDRVDLGVAGDVARQDERGVLERARQLLDALLQTVALVGEGEAHPLARESLRDRPRNRALVSHTENDSGLSFEHRHGADDSTVGGSRRAEGGA